MLKILVTGGAGFIGSNFIHYVLSKYSDWQITNLDKLTYAGNLENLNTVENDPRYKFIKADIANHDQVSKILIEDYDVLINFAAESHVDRSIINASPFIDANIKGTQVLLDAVRQYGVKKMVQVSTDEVYGSQESGQSDENSPLLPNSTYSASKTAADLLCRAYYQTHNLPVVVTRCTNNYGPCQFPEKLIPLVISNAFEGKDIPVYGDGSNIREWIYVEDHCNALAAVIEKGQPGEIYNVGTGNGISNLEIVKLILDKLGKPHSLIKFVADRLGHDHRYSLNTIKIQQQLGWKSSISFETGIKITIQWYLDNKEWWQRIKSGEYAEYYTRMYSGR